MLNATIAQVDLWRIEREGEELLIHLLETMFSNEESETGSVPVRQMPSATEVHVGL